MNKQEKRKIMENKSFFTSKTVWVSLLIFIASVLQALNIINLDLSPDAAWIGIAWSIIQTLLRLVTKQPLTVNTKAASKILPLLILLLILSGCSSSRVETVKEHKISFKPELIKATSMPGEYKNFTDAEILSIETTFEKLPDSGYITTEAMTPQGKVEAKFYPKKKPLILQLCQFRKIQQLKTQFINLRTKTRTPEAKAYLC